MRKRRLLIVLLAPLVPVLAVSSCLPCERVRGKVFPERY